jgi:L-fucose mutarotase
MLKGVDPILSGEVLGALRDMGHGDELIVADSNFPAGSVAALTCLGRVLRIEQPAARVVRAVLSVYPLDTFVEGAAGRMQVGDDPDEVAAVHAEVQAEVDAAEGRRWGLVPIERFDFYARARAAYAVIQTGERRFYGCFTFRKGVVPPEA